MVHPSASPSPSFSLNVLYIDLRFLLYRSNDPRSIPPSLTSSLSPITPSSASFKLESTMSLPTSSPQLKVQGYHPAVFSSCQQPDGLYFHFPSAAAYKTWFALFQSIMIPEIYSIPSITPTAALAFVSDPFLNIDQHLSPLSGETSFPTAYRIKRKLSITVKEARFHPSSSSSHLGTPSSLLFPLSPTPPPFSLAIFPHSKNPKRPTESHDEDHCPTTSVELRMGSQTVARTTTRRKDHSPYFSEEFIFDHFGSGGAEGGAMGREERQPVKVIVWKEKKGKLSVLGELDVTIGNMLGETVEGWCPLLADGVRSVGELRVSAPASSARDEVEKNMLTLFGFAFSFQTKLKIVATEQIVFPCHHYARLSSVCYLLSSSSRSQSLIVCTVARSSSPILLQPSALSGGKSTKMSSAGRLCEPPWPEAGGRWSVSSSCCWRARAWTPLRSSDRARC
jgi:hypothetical protein